MPKDKFVSKASSKRMKYKSKKHAKFAAIFVSSAAVLTLAVLLVIAGIKHMPKPTAEKAETTEETPAIPEKVMEQYEAIPEELTEEDPVPIKENVLYIEDTGVSMDFVNLIAAIYKNKYSSFAEAEDGTWNSVINNNGTTVSQKLSAEVLDTVTEYLAFEHMHDEVFCLELPDSASNDVTLKMNMYINLAGSEDALKEMLASCGTDIYELNRYLFLEAKYNNLKEYFYGDNGVYRITDEKKKQIFASEYAIVTHIFFNTAEKKDEYGASIPLTTEEISAKKASASAVFGSIKTIDDFYAMKAQYNEDIYEGSYFPNGFFVTNGSTFPQEFTSTALEMEIGGFRMLETDSGIHIMTRLAMNPDLYNSDDSVYYDITDKLTLSDFNARIDAEMSLVQMSKETEALIENIDFTKITAFNTAE